MEWYVQWIQAFAAFASRTEYPSAIAQLKQLDAHPICKNNLVNIFFQLRTLVRRLIHSKARASIVTENLIFSLILFLENSLIFRIIFSP